MDSGIYFFTGIYFFKSAVNTFSSVNLISMLSLLSVIAFLALCHDILRIFPVKYARPPADLLQDRNHRLTLFFLIQRTHLFFFHHIRKSFFFVVTMKFMSGYFPKQATPCTNKNRRRAGLTLRHFSTTGLFYYLRPVSSRSPAPL